MLERAINIVKKPRRLIAITAGGAILVIGGSAAWNAFSRKGELNPEAVPQALPIQGGATQALSDCKIYINGEEVAVQKGVLVDDAVCLGSRDGISMWTLSIGGRPAIARTVDESN